MNVDAAQPARGVLGGLVLTIVSASVAAAPPQPDWQVVVNNGFEVPGNPGRLYNSYNPPSVNAGALVVFRARSTGHQQGPVGGIYVRDMAPAAPIRTVADRATEVPQPNNIEYPLPGGQGATLARFNEFPSFPRIAATADVVATRGNHPPVWSYVTGLDPETGEPIETRAGTTGVYVDFDPAAPSGGLVTGASQLGLVPEFVDRFVVPGVSPATRFDVFPGAPSVTDGGIIAVKGNYSVPDPAYGDPDVTLGNTGVFYRRVTSEPVGGDAPVELVANSDTPIPNRGRCAAGTTFGSTAPPSAAGAHLVFVGYDDEDEPTCGGIYRAPLTQPPERLTVLVGLETRVPGQGRETFDQLGEGLSYDGRLVAFWGAWGDATMTVRLYCPEEGNQTRQDYCNNTGQFAPDQGDPDSICNETTDPMWPICFQEKEVPVNQGIFVYDSAVGSPAQRLRLLARTGRGGRFDDFVYWNYSGHPGAAEHGDDAEPPRFRASAFVATSTGSGGSAIRVAFVGRTGDLDPVTHAYADPVDGVYLASGPGQGPVRTLVETGMDGTLLDPEAVWDDDHNPATADVPLPISSVAMERDAFRGDWLAIAARMGVEDAGWAGIYLTNLSD